MKHLAIKEILARIHQAGQFDELRVTRDQVHEMFREHLLFAYSAEFARDINTIHDSLIQRTIALAEQQLEARGMGRPPAPYAFMLFGSGGRSEQTLWSDQDNGLIYEEPGDCSGEASALYFAELVGCILQGLEVLGYPPCQGNVVSSNPQWRKTLSSYMEMMHVWFAEPNWENVRYLLILADMRCIYGAPHLVERLKEEMITYIQQHGEILPFLLSNTLHHKITLGVFGQLIKERYGEDAGGFDIKYGAYIPIVNGIRLLSLQAGIAASSTLQRLVLLKEGGFVAEPLIDRWRQAFEITLRLRDSTPFQVEEGMYTTRSKLSAEQLTKERRASLKFALRVGMDLQKYVKKSLESKEGNQREKR
ncbi:DUF294 nucleotidyltransferase-like domain-containing protein [Paenibacillus aestuarii]|uniref:DUF294 nucleotidyltransferase-like domain-containing protein n=1 Tax=Paenibacillus aestuarii TaxID=516965 RepID=A0ABW0KGK2_9BACL|nr:DUF294 nucleotidyltransferase-like domain-containing protein [Paenibacillus aestuarii]